MPIYEFECPHCGLIEERVMKLENSNVLFTKHYCAVKIAPVYARKIVSRPQAMKPDWEEYWDDNLEATPGKAALITGRKARKELMKKQGLEDKGTDSSKLRIRKQEFAERRIERLKERGEFDG